MMQKQNNEDDEVKRMLMELLEQEAFVDISEEFELPPVAISCGYYNEYNLDGTSTTLPIPIGTYGNFSFIQAPPKSMKSFFSSLLVSAYQSGGNKLTGKIKGHRDNKKIIHFDTEQSKFHCQKLFRRPIIMNQLEKDDNYYTYALRPMDAKDRIDFIEYILYNVLDAKEIGLVIIDGVADLVTDVNNLEQCSYATQKIMKWTDELKCHITTVIHTNYGSDKPTGHLGSFLEKKAETQIKLEKNGVNEGWITVNCKRSRNRGFDDFSFLINEKGLPEWVNNDYEF
ncbi:MAG: AAA family ATPase [Winogradskyella sp.]